MGTTTVATLIARCHTGSIAERCGAIVDLQEMGARQAVPDLVKLLESSEADVRANAARALGVLGDESVAASLLARIGDSVALVRLLAIEAMGILGCAEAVETLTDVVRADADPLVRLHAAEALGALGRASAEPALAAALDDPDEKVRAYAADALAVLRCVGSAPSLRRKLEHEPSVFARAFLLSALTRLGDSEALGALLALVEQADDLLAATILTLAVEATAPAEADHLIAEIRALAPRRPALLHEVDALVARLAAADDGIQPDLVHRPGIAKP